VRSWARTDEHRNASEPPPREIISKGGTRNKPKDAKATMKRITTSVALAITLSMTAAASAEDCDLQRAHWVCVPNQEPGAIQQFLDRFHQTMDRALTPPGGWRQDTAVPPESVPQDSRLGPQEQWRKAIIAEAERFCAAYPNDPVCHFKDPGPGGATPAR
jgi:hypothetical protein